MMRPGSKKWESQCMHYLNLHLVYLTWQLTCTRQACILMQVLLALVLTAQIMLA